MNHATLLMILTGAAMLVGGLSRVFANGKEPPRARYVVAIGDSLTAHKGYCQTLESLLPVGSMVTCQGYVGEGSSAIAEKIDPAVLAQADDVIVLAGVNDLASGRGVQGALEGLEKIYQKARVAGARVIAVHLTPWASHPKGAKYFYETRQLNEWIDKSPSVELTVDTSGLGPDGYLLSGYGTGDGLHLSAEGQDKLGEIIFQQAYGG